MSPRLAFMVSAILRLSNPSAYGSDMIRLESSYRGEGVFEYKLAFPDDQYFAKCGFQTFGGINFTNFTEFTDVPPNWTAEVSPPTLPEYAPVVGWRHQQGVLEDVPYSCVFRVRTSETSYRTSGSTVTMSLEWNPWAYPTDSPTNVLEVAYANLSCLVPCSAAESDGSPANLVSTMSGPPTLRIDQSLYESNRLVGFQFTSGGFKVSIQASPDLKAWTTITNLNATVLSTVWKSAVPLDAFGNFFRIKIGPD